MKKIMLLAALSIFVPLSSTAETIDLVCQAGGRIAGHIKVETDDMGVARIKLGYVEETVFLVNHSSEDTRFIMKDNTDIQIELANDGWARLYDYEEDTGDTKPSAVYRCE